MFVVCSLVGSPSIPGSHRQTYVYLHFPACTPPCQATVCQNSLTAPCSPENVPVADSPPVHTGHSAKCDAACREAERNPQTKMAQRHLEIASGGTDGSVGRRRTGTPGSARIHRPGWAAGGEWGGPGEAVSQFLEILCPLGRVAPARPGRGGVWYRSRWAKSRVSPEARDEALPSDAVFQHKEP